MFADKVTREELLKLAKKRIYLEGNILKVLKAENGDTELEEYWKLKLRIEIKPLVKNV